MICGVRALFLSTDVIQSYTRCSSSSRAIFPESVETNMQNKSSNKKEVLLKQYITQKQRFLPEIKGKQRSRSLQSDGDSVAVNPLLIKINREGAGMVEHG